MQPVAICLEIDVYSYLERKTKTRAPQFPVERLSSRRRTSAIVQKSRTPVENSPAR
jgi:hypothetical protein